jgi:hypothetical protein
MSGLFNRTRFDAGLSAGRYELVNIIFDEWITFRRAEHARLWRSLQGMEAALRAYPDQQAARLLTEARGALTRPPVAVADLGQPERFRDLVRVPRGLAVPEAQARIEAEIRSAIAAQAADAAAKLRQAAERLATAGWTNSDDGLAGGLP